MFIKTFEIENFRCFSNTKFSLHENLTVFVGKNGAGKTSILDAIAANICYFFNEYKIERNDFFSINDINKSAPDAPIRFTSRVSELSQTGRVVTSFKKDISDVNKLAFDSVTVSSEEQNNIIPVIGQNSTLTYYTVYRNINYLTQGTIQAEHELLPSINYKACLAWFDSKDAEEARTRSKRQDLKYNDPILSAVRSAITQALGGEYEFPHMDGTPPDLYVTHIKSGYDFRVSQLSDGYKAMLALVMDLARRMAQTKQKISPNSKTPALEYPGIVLIDEIELHLHPAWQQTVLPTLKKSFPNVQFIVTTHSPQVVSSVRPESIRILNNGRIGTPSFGTYGAESSAILEDIFGTYARAHHEGTEMLDRYLAYVNAGKGTTLEALELRRILNTTLSGDSILALADSTMQQPSMKKLKKH